MVDRADGLFSLRIPNASVRTIGTGAADDDGASS